MALSSPDTHLISTSNFFNELPHLPLIFSVAKYIQYILNFGKEKKKVPQCCTRYVYDGPVSCEKGL